MPDFIKADEAAFKAYNIMYYPLFGDSKGGAMFDSAALDDAPMPDESDYMLALAVQDNLAGTPYVLSDKAMGTLSRAFAALKALGGEVTIDPAADVRTFCPDTALGDPMYPDFPSQVLEIDENVYRMHQITNYLSTYGVEALAGLLGIDMQAQKGWRPDVTSTAKIHSGEQLIDKHVLELVVSENDMAQIVAGELARPMRMSVPAARLALSLFCAGALPQEALGKIAFHENMMTMAVEAANGSSSDFAEVLGGLAQHPGDIFKAVLALADANEKNHVPTKAKKGFCRALDAYEPHSISANLADLGKRGQKAANMLSVSRFASEKVKGAIDDVASGEVRSYNARIEAAWKDYADGEDPDGKALIALYKQRPGIMLRSAARMLDGGLGIEAVGEALLECKDSYSLATLVQLLTTMSAQDDAKRMTWNGFSMDDAERARLEAKKACHARLASLLAPVLYERLAEVAFEGKGKKVFLDPCGFSLAGSVILPNEVGNTGGAYPPAGMAFDVPSDKTVRFFTFWDDRTNRVDVDLHFHYTDTDGKYGHLGWNSSFRGNGMATSGDITDSIDAAEYLDIDMEVAAQSGVDTVFQQCHVYTRQEWKDIETCFSGAMVIGETDPSTEIYQSENVLFHDDMEGDGTQMEYAMIDVPSHFVRILRGTKLPYRHTAFTLKTFLGLFLEAQGCEMVEDPLEAELVLSVGRSRGDSGTCVPVVSVIDEKFFIE